MSSKMLPTAQPPVICSLTHAYPLAIGACQEKPFWPWFYSNYIQLQCTENTKQFKVDFFFQDPRSYTLPYMIVYRIERAHAVGKSYHEWVMQWIDEQLYVLLYLDHFYVKGSPNYNSMHHVMPTMFVGYDRDSAILYLLGFGPNGEFMTLGMDIADFEYAYRTTNPAQPSHSSFYLYKSRSAAYEFDIQNVIELLDDYLHSRNTSVRFRALTPPVKDQVFGLQVYNKFEQYFDNLIKGEANLDVKPLHLLWEHKKNMTLRLHYMVKEGYLEDHEQLLDRYKQLEDRIFQLRKGVLKYLFTKDRSQLTEIRSVIGTFAQQEEEILSRVMQNIRQAATC